MVAPPPIKPAVAPTPSISNAQSISIKESMELFKEAPIIPDHQLPRTPLNIDSLRLMARKYAQMMRDDGKETFYHAVVKRDFFFHDEHITWVVDNDVQLAYLSPLLVDFMSYLKKELNNGFLTISLELTKEVATENRPYTGKDKFQALARKNPNLHTLKNRFNLDIEF